MHNNFAVIFSSDFKCFIVRVHVAYNYFIEFLNTFKAFPYNLCIIAKTIATKWNCPMAFAQVLKGLTK